MSEKTAKKATVERVAIDAFCKALGNDITVSGTEIVKTPAARGPGSELLPAAKFAELLQKYSSADYLVSFVGVPHLTPGQIAQLPSPRPRVVAVITQYPPPTRAMFEGQVLCLAAVPKLEVQNEPVKGSAREIFDAQYQLVTPETAGVLAR
jgi:hypothetical protein